MPQWKDADQANNSPNYVARQFGLRPNSTHQTALFGNSTANGFVAGETIGVWGVDPNEMLAARAGGAARPANPGWVIKHEGSGGRANRISYEVLATMKSFSSDSENTAFPQYSLQIVSNPSNKSANATADAVATFSVNAVSVPAGATITYFWQKWGGAAFANLAASGAYSNVTTKTLSVLANTASNGEIYRCGVASANGVVANNIYSSNAVLTITT